LYIVV